VRTTAEQPATGGDASGGPLRILVVEDDEDLRALYREVLSEVGSVETCPDAHQALARLEVEPVDVVVLDLLLPGASGLDLLERLRAKGIDVPTVVVTASGDGHWSNRAHDAGAAVVMEKPFDRRILAFNVTQAATRGDPPRFV